MCAYLCHGDAWVVSRGTELVSSAGSDRFITESQENMHRYFVLMNFTNLP